MQLSKGKHGPNRNDNYLVPLLEAEPYSRDYYKTYHDSDEPWFGGEKWGLFHRHKKIAPTEGYSDHNAINIYQFPSFQSNCDGNKLWKTFLGQSRGINDICQDFEASWINLINRSPSNWKVHTWQVQQ